MTSLDLTCLELTLSDCVHCLENYTKKGKKKGPDARNEKQFDNIHQKPNESDSSYMRRVNRITQESVEEAKFEAKYGVEVIRDKKSGEIKLKKRPVNEIDERLKQNAANAKKGGKKVKAPIVIAPEERKKLIKAMIKEKKEKESETKAKTEVKEFEREEIKFGEVAHAPPQLTVPRLAKKAETVPRVRFFLRHLEIVSCNYNTETFLSYSAWPKIASASLSDRSIF